MERTPHKYLDKVGIRALWDYIADIYVRKSDKISLEPLSFKIDESHVSFIAPKESEVTANINSTEFNGFTEFLQAESVNKYVVDVQNKRYERIAQVNVNNTYGYSCNGIIMVGPEAQNHIDREKGGVTYNTGVLYLLYYTINMPPEGDPAKSNGMPTYTLHWSRFKFE